MSEFTRLYGKEQSPNERVQFASIGVGGKGDSDSNDAGKFGELIAICDIDDETLEKKAKKFPKAKKFNDYREMLDKLGNQIDAVTVSTPDHSHAVASALAMRMGKHCFTQKPLTWNIEEARVLRQLAADKKLATQMGNQGTAHNGLREGAEVMRTGALGKVKEIHVWTNRPVWPQGITRPATGECPKNVHWDLFVGPAAERPYHPECHPFKWRGYLDYGTGALGDMACHTLNVAFMGLDLVDPLKVEVVDTSGIVANETFPTWSVIRYEFGPRGDRPGLVMTWYDGGDNLPESKRVPKEYFHGEKRDDSGLLVVGEKGTFYSQNDYGSEYLLLPRKEYLEYKKPEPTIPRSPGHFEEFIRAIKGGPAAMSNFDYASKLTETVLLGVVALRAGSTIEWDAAAMKAKNCPTADQFIRRQYRKGFELI